LFSAALSRLLSGPPLYACVQTTGESTTALDIIASQQVDLVLCDVRAGPLPARQLVAATASTPTRVVLLSDAEDETLLAAELMTPVAGLFTKDAQPREFLQGVQAILAGHQAVAGRVLRNALDAKPAAQGGPDGAARALSPTERDILARLGAAQSVAVIADARGISEKTVRNHMASIYRKLNLRGRTEAMLCAVRLGLTET
jgi:DNA-binding NarL/FixJ family response regulator